MDAGERANGRSGGRKHDVHRVFLLEALMVKFPNQKCGVPGNQKPAPRYVDPTLSTTKIHKLISKMDEMDWDAAELANRSGVSVHTVRGALDGGLIVTKALKKMCAALELDLDEKAPAPPPASKSAETPAEVAHV